MNKYICNVDNKGKEEAEEEAEEKDEEAEAEDKKEKKKKKKETMLTGIPSNPQPTPNTGDISDWNNSISFKTQTQD